MALNPAFFSPVYGPVQSWRYGRSLGIDPIGPRSTCSFDCVYCQLGVIESHQRRREIFVGTDAIQRSLKQALTQHRWAHSPGNPSSTNDPGPSRGDELDVVTLSGSGEPTLALNLKEIIASAKLILQRPVVVLTNGSLLNQSQVRSALALADQVAVKLDATTNEAFQRFNRPAGIPLSAFLEQLRAFSRNYPGRLAFQTMVLTPWSKDEMMRYLQIVRDCQPDEIQLNLPKRAKPQTRYLDARENDPSFADQNPPQCLRCVDMDVLEKMARRIETSTGIPTKYPV